MTDKRLLTERLDQLESAIDQQQEIIARQQATIDHQQARLDELAAVQPASGTLGGEDSLPISRRGSLRAAGALALLGFGAGTAAAEPQPQGRVGTEDRPLNALHTVDLKSTGIEATGIEAAEIGATEIEAEGIEATEIKAEGIDAEGIEATEIGATEIDAEGIEATEIKATEIDAEGIEATEIGATEIETTEITAENNISNGWGVRGVNTSGSGYGVYSDGDSRTDGNHETTGDTEVGGELSFADGSPQLTGGPIAKGWIDSSEENSFGDPIPTLENGVNVEDVTWFIGDENIVSTAYEITLSNIHYTSNEYVTLATPHHRLGDPRAIPAVFANQGGDLRIRFEDPDGNVVHPDFQFVTYALPDGSEITNNGG